MYILVLPICIINKNIYFEQKHLIFFFTLLTVKTRCYIRKGIINIS